MVQAGQNKSSIEQYKASKCAELAAGICNTVKTNPDRLIIEHCETLIKVQKKLKELGTGINLMEEKTNIALSSKSLPGWAAMILLAVMPVLAKDLQLDQLDLIRYSAMQKVLHLIRKYEITPVEAKSLSSLMIIAFKELFVHGQENIFDGYCTYCPRCN